MYTFNKNIDYPRLCHYPCLLARCPANNAKEENVKLIEISFVSWFSSLLGQVQKAAEIINRSQTHSIVGLRICNRILVTSLGLWHLCVPHLAQASFLPKNQTLQNAFSISVTLR